MPRRKTNPRQRKKLTKSRGFYVLSAEVVCALSEHFRVLKLADASPVDVEEPLESLQERFPGLVGIPECADAKPSLSERLAQLKSPAASDQIGVKLSVAGQDVEQLLNPTENEKPLVGKVARQFGKCQLAKQ